MVTRYMGVDLWTSFSSYLFRCYQLLFRCSFYQAWFMFFNFRVYIAFITKVDWDIFKHCLNLSFKEFSENFFFIILLSFIVFSTVIPVKLIRHEAVQDLDLKRHALQCTRLQTNLYRAARVLVLQLLNTRFRLYSFYLYRCKYVKYDRSIQ